MLLKSLQISTLVGGGRGTYEAWKVGRQVENSRKRKTGQEELERHSISTDRSKSVRLDLCSSEIKETQTFNTTLLTCSGTKGASGDALGAGEVVQEGAQGLRGGDEEVTSEKITVQRAGLGEQNFTILT